MANKHSKSKGFDRSPEQYEVIIDGLLRMVQVQSRALEVLSAFVEKMLETVREKEGEEAEEEGGGPEDEEAEASPS